MAGKQNIVTDSSSNYYIEIKKRGKMLKVMEENNNKEFGIKFLLGKLMLEG
jgi:hypothetical protein